MNTHLYLCLAFIVCAVGGCSSRLAPNNETSSSISYTPPSRQEHAIALRQTWRALIAERTRREQAAAQTRQEEATLDALRQLPWVSLTSGGQTTLVEAVNLLLHDTGYSVVYGPYVDASLPVATHITRLRLDRAMTALVHPFGYQVQLKPGERQIHITSLMTRMWQMPLGPETETSTEPFWHALRRDLQQLVHGEREHQAPGFVRIEPQTGQVTVAALVLRMPQIDALMSELSATPIHSREGAQ
jgi:hypothetical protein